MGACADGACTFSNLKRHDTSPSPHVVLHMALTSRETQPCGEPSIVIHPISFQSDRPSAPAERRSHVGQDGVDDMGVVVDAELVGDGEEQRVGLGDRLVAL